jgi:hypothetical protein
MATFTTTPIHDWTSEDVSDWLKAGVGKKCGW